MLKLNRISVRERIIILVELEWIYKERPVDDERTVIIHFNEKLQQEKVELLNFISDAIASRATAMQNSLNAIIAV